MVKKCLECGKEFEIEGTEYLVNHKMYCSEYCGKKHRLKMKSEVKAYKVFCTECGKEFEAVRSNCTCCSPECRAERARRRAREYGEAFKVKSKTKEAPEEKVKKIEAHEIEAEARKHGMHYGMYTAMLQMEKERAQRLKRMGN